MSKVISVCSSGGKVVTLSFTLCCFYVELVSFGWYCYQGYHIDIEVFYELDFNFSFKYSNDYEKNKWVLVLNKIDKNYWSQ